MVSLKPIAVILNQLFILPHTTHFLFGDRKKIIVETMFEFLLEDR